MDANASLIERFEHLASLADALPAADPLRGELQELRAQLVRHEVACHALRGELADLASLFVATDRLHSTLDRDRVLDALQEIVTSLLGCKELAVFELLGTPAVLAPISILGVAPGRIGLVNPGEGVIGRAVLSGETWLGDGRVAEAAGFEETLSACVPLKVDGRVTGALALFRLLPRKPRLEESDRELLELLSRHAGTALLASRLRPRHAPEA
jgi:hypothetical protein